MAVKDSVSMMKLLRRIGDFWQSHNKDGVGKDSQNIERKDDIIDGSPNSLNISSDAEMLYRELSANSYKNYPYEQYDLGENMTLVNQAINEYWKPRYFMDHDAKSAYEFMSESEILLTVTDEDIDWYSMRDLSQDDLNVAMRHSFHYPGHIFGYENGIATVQWQLHPDGMFFCDEDGYGMTPDVEINIVGAIDRIGRVVRKFMYKP